MNHDMYTYKVTIKEVDSDYPLNTSITTDQGLDYVRSFFGLEDTDVEWYTIEKETSAKSE